MTNGMERRGEFLLSSHLSASSSGVDIAVLCPECDLRCRIRVTSTPNDKVLAMIESNALEQMRARHNEWGCRPMHGPERPLFLEET